MKSEYYSVTCSPLTNRQLQDCSSKSNSLNNALRAGNPCLRIPTNPWNTEKGKGERLSLTPSKKLSQQARVVDGTFW